MASLLRKYRCVIFLFVAMMVLDGAQAKGIEIPQLSLSAQSEANMADRVLVFSDNGIPVPEQKAALIPWLQGLKPAQRLSLTGGVYWYLISLNNDTTNDNWVIDLGNGLIEQIDYYVYHADSLQHLTSGYYSQDEFFLTYARSITIPAGSGVTLAIKIQSSQFSSIPSLTITPADRYPRYEFMRLTVIMVALGALLCLSLYNLFLYFGTRQSELLYYALFIISYVFALGGLLQVFADLFNFYYLHLIYVPFFLIPFFSGKFCVIFLELEQTAPNHAKYLNIIGTASLFMGGITVLLPSYANAIGSIFLAVWIGVALSAGIIRKRQGFQPARYFVIAFLFLLIPGCIILPSNLGLTPDFFPDKLLLALLGGLLDGLLLAFAISYRVRLLDQENQALNYTLENKVQERTAELQQVNKDLLSANESKRQFLANIGHEIRTPMTSIIGFSDLMVSDNNNSNQNNDYARVINSSSHHLLSIVDDLLDMTKIEAKKLTYSFTQVNICDVINALIQSFAPQVKDKHLALNVEFHQSLPHSITTDLVRLKQILINIISNAIKFTELGEINIDVSREGDTVCICISDTGMGMDQEQLTRLFTPFEQGDNSVSRRYGGTGLGMYISHQLALGLRGELTCNTTLGKGSSFYLTLPFDNAIKDETRKKNTGISHPLKSAGFIKPKNMTGINILIADDVASNRELLVLLLKKTNATVHLAEDGAQALEIVARKDIDIIMLDIQMPKLDGISALTELRKQAFNNPIIALTANSMKHQVEAYLDAGFDGHIAKPISTDTFYQSLSQLCIRHKIG